jgi:hypothetical protein
MDVRQGVPPAVQRRAGPFGEIEPGDGSGWEASSVAFCIMIAVPKQNCPGGIPMSAARITVSLNARAAAMLRRRAAE